MSKQEIAKLWFSPAEFAELVGIHENTIRLHCQDGTIPALRVGKQYRIPSAYLIPTPIPVHDEGDNE